MSTSLGPDSAPVQRWDRLDALRGVAVLWMTAFHFSFDLAYFGLTQQNFYTDPVWLWQRTAILSLFLACAGLGQSQAVMQGQTWRRFWRRWAQVAGCAVLVSVGSWIMFPRSWIYFGVLHGMAVMLILARWTALRTAFYTGPRMAPGTTPRTALGAAGWGVALCLAAACAVGLALLAPTLHRQGWLPAVLDTPTWHWLGLMSHKPITEDYVPVLPWMAVMWLALVLGPRLQARGWLAGPVPGGRVGSALAFVGRWSLTWYMLHQPILIGALMLLTRRH